MKNSSEKRPRSVCGRLLVPAFVTNLNNARAHLRLEDISYADAGAAVLAEIEISPLDAQEIFFELKIPDAAVINPGNDYSVSVWIDLDGDGIRSGEDLFSDTVYPVLTRGQGDYVEIEIKSKS